MTSMHLAVEGEGAWATVVLKGRLTMLLPPATGLQCIPIYWTPGVLEPIVGVLAANGVKLCIAVFPILADVVKVKKGSGSTAHWSIDFIRLSGWLRRCFTLLITPLDIERIGQNWEDSNSNLR